MHAPVRERMLAVLPLLLCAVCCSRTPATPERPTPRLPSGSAGQVLSHALDAAGGWNHWAETEDVSFVGTLTLIDQGRNISSESIGWYRAPLHAGMRARMESIGLSSQITFGVNGDDTWIYRDGERLEDPDRLAVTRFDLVSSMFWFSLPFSLAELSGKITDIGPSSAGASQFDRLRVEFESGQPNVLGTWIVLYFDHGTGLIDHVHAQLSASFLRHELWIGKWLEYHDSDGFKKERLRQFFPADQDGEIVGPLVATQLVEHIRVNNGFKRDLFDVPRPTKGAQRASLDVRDRSDPSFRRKAGIQAYDLCDDLRRCQALAQTRTASPQSMMSSITWIPAFAGMTGTDHVR